jgi:hypothetical protein
LSKFASNICIAFGFCERLSQTILSKCFSRSEIAFKLKDIIPQLISLSKFTAIISIARGLGLREKLFQLIRSKLASNISSAFGFADKLYQSTRFICCSKIYIAFRLEDRVCQQTLSKCFSIN